MNGLHSALHDWEERLYTVILETEKGRVGISKYSSLGCSCPDCSGTWTYYILVETKEAHDSALFECLLGSFNWRRGSEKLCRTRVESESSFKKRLLRAFFFIEAYKEGCEPKTEFFSCPKCAEEVLSKPDQFQLFKELKSNLEMFIHQKKQERLQRFKALFDEGARLANSIR